MPVEPIVDAPPVSAIIPTRNQAQLLRSCIEGLAAADYPQVEIIVVDNGSDEPEALDYLARLEARGCKVLRRPGPFNFSRLNNDAVQHTAGSMLCFLNNDVEMIDRSWLSLMVRQAMRPEIGAVGAMLLYPDHTIQHAGVYLGIGGGAGHAHRFLAENDPGYFERARLPQLVSAVTAACMVVARDKFLAVGGFEEALFPVAFNDVDLCLKLNSCGWQSFYEPRARLVHHESKSRGLDSWGPNRARFAGELAALKAKWHTDRGPDPFHHPQLSPYSEQFVVAV
jgi:GT2 family glycosyltransferase